MSSSNLALEIIDSPIRTSALRVRELFQCSLEIPDDGLKILVATQLSRFKLWGANIGVYAPLQSSLDYRLRTAPTTRAAVDDNLEILCTDLLCVLAGRETLTNDELDAFASKQIHDIASFGKALVNYSTASIREAEVEKSAGKEAGNISVSRDNLVHNSNGPQVRARKSFLESIQLTIDTLHRLSLTICTASNRNRLDRATRLFNVDDGYMAYKTSEDLQDKSGIWVKPEMYDITSEFEGFLEDILRARWGWAETAIGLEEEQRGYREIMLKRCVTSISARRRQLAYFQAHHHKLSAVDNREDFLGSEADQETRHERTTAYTLPSKYSTSRLNESALVQKALKPSSNLCDLHLEPSPADHLPAVPDVGARTGRKDAAEDPLFQFSEPFEFPDPPNLSTEEREAMCPYCCLVFPVEVFALSEDSQRWRHHLVDDMQPYICLFENCDQPGKTYRTPAEWQVHLNQPHVQHWICTSEHHDVQISDNGQAIFDNPEMLQEHLELAHRYYDTFHSAKPAYVKTKRAKLTLWCFICSKSHEEEIGLQAHLATHLQTAFVLALPDRENLAAPNPDRRRSVSNEPSTKGSAEPHNRPSTRIRDPSTGETPTTEGARASRLLSEHFAQELKLINDRRVSQEAEEVRLDIWLSQQSEALQQARDHMISRRWRFLLLTFQYFARFNGVRNRLKEAQKLVNEAVHNVQSLHPLQALATPLLRSRAHISPAPSVSPRRLPEKTPSPAPESQP